MGQGEPLACDARRPESAEMRLNFAALGLARLLQSPAANMPSPPSTAALTLPSHFLPLDTARRAACIAVALAGLLSGCQRARATAEVAEAPHALRVATPKAGGTSYELEYVGQVRAVRYAEVRSRVKGVIEAVAIDEGSPVKADQVLFSIRSHELQQELLKAKAATAAADAELKLSRIERDNTRMLFDKNVVSSAEMALADSKIEALAAQLEQAKAAQSQASINLTYTKVRAPFDGIVNRIPHKTGSMLSEEGALTTIADASEVFVYFRMSEREHLEYSAASPEERPRAVSLRLADGSLHPHQGVIDTVENEVDVETGNIALRARFPNPTGTLKHGSSGKVVIRTELPHALVVAQKSTFEIQGRLYVYVVDADSRARAREIVPKVRLSDSFVIAEGLTADERFVVEGVQKLKDGARVKPVPAS